MEKNIVIDLRDINSTHLRCGCWFNADEVMDIAVRTTYCKRHIMFILPDKMVIIIPRWNIIPTLVDIIINEEREQLRCLDIVSLTKLFDLNPKVLHARHMIEVQEELLFKIKLIE